MFTITDKNDDRILTRWLNPNESASVNIEGNTVQSSFGNVTNGEWLELTRKENERAGRAMVICEHPENGCLRALMLTSLWESKQEK